MRTNEFVRLPGGWVTFSVVKAYPRHACGYQGRGGMRVVHKPNYTIREVDGPSDVSVVAWEAVCDSVAPHEDSH